MADVDGDGHVDLIVPVSYFFDVEVFRTQPHKFKVCHVTGNICQVDVLVLCFRVYVRGYPCSRLFSLFLSPLSV